MPQPAATALKKTYDETLGLLVETRNYLAYKAPAECRRMPADTSLRVSCEAFRITTRLTQAMAWLMAQRAVHAGEMALEEACSDHFRLSGHAVCLQDAANEDMPAALRSLLARSLSLYERIARLDDMTARRMKERRA